jgi:hypothetical protein
LAGANAMALSRWKTTRGMPSPPRHGKHDVEAVLAWVWKWKLELESEAAQPTEGRNQKNDELLDIRIERERLELERDKQKLVPLADWTEAEGARIQLAISLLYSIPDILISEGIIRDQDRDRALELIGGPVDALQQRMLETPE